MHPLDFYIHPNNLNYEKDVDPVGRDLIKQINNTDYFRTTMYCSGHFTDEQEYPWMEGKMELCLFVYNQKLLDAAVRLEACEREINEVLGYGKARGGSPYRYVDNDVVHYIADFIVDYGTKENRDIVISILKKYLK